MFSSIGMISPNSFVVLGGEANGYFSGDLDIVTLSQETTVGKMKRRDVLKNNLTDTKQATLFAMHLTTRSTVTSLSSVQEDRY